MKKKILIALSYVLIAALAITGTIAYLQDTDEDVNVMTLGNVYIEQIEQERDENGNLIDFMQAKPAYPAVVASSESWWPRTPVEVNEGVWANMWGDDVNNDVDKIVTVKNTGKSDAYVRTIIAVESADDNDWHLSDMMGGYYATEADALSKTNKVQTMVGNAWEDIGNVVIDGVNYYLLVATYKNPVAAGAISAPSMTGVALDSTLGNDQVAKYGETWDILVFSQAVQTNGFSDAKTALDTAFGEITATNNPWVTNGETTHVPAIPAVFSYEGVNYITEGDTATVNSTGGDTMYRGVLSDGKSAVTEVIVDEGITRLNNRAICKAPTITSVELPSTLTYIDEGALQQSGITSIEIPENVTYIGKTALGACDKLETIVIRAKDVTFANYVARDCKALKEVYIYSDSVTFESGGSMYFTNAQTGDASAVTFYVGSQAIADALYNSSYATRSYGMLIKSLDGATEYYNTLK